MAFLDLRKAFDLLEHRDYMTLEWVVVHSTGLLIIFLFAIKELNFIIPILHGDWLEVACLKVVPWGPYFFLCM